MNYRVQLPHGKSANKQKCKVLGGSSALEMLYAPAALD